MKYVLEKNMVVRMIQNSFKLVLYLSLTTDAS